MSKVNNCKAIADRQGSVEFIEVFTANEIWIGYFCFNTNSKMRYQ